MPQGNFHVNKYLTNFAIKYKSNYIGHKCIGMLPVQKETDHIFIYSQDHRIDSAKVGNGAESMRVGLNGSYTTYALNEYALHDIVTDRDRANADAPVQLDMDATNFVVDKVLRDFEMDVAKLLFTTGTWSNSVSLGSATSWRNETTTAYIMTQVLSGTAKILEASGVLPNRMIMDHYTKTYLQTSSDLLDRIKYTQRGVLTEELLAALFGVDDIYVGSAQYWSTKEGADTLGADAVWPDACLLGYFKDRPAGKEPVAASVLFQPQFGNPYVIRKWRENKNRGDVVECGMFAKPRALATMAAYLWTDTGA